MGNKNATLIAFCIIFLILLFVYERTRDEGITPTPQNVRRQRLSPPPGYILHDGHLQAQLNAATAEAQNIDLRKVQLVSEGGKTGYYSGGVFVPLYGTALSDVKAATSAIRDFGSVDVPIPQMTQISGGADTYNQTSAVPPKPPTMSTSRALSTDEFKEADTSSFDWAAASANASALSDSENIPTPDVSADTYANFGSASGGDNASAARGAPVRSATGISKLFAYNELERGSRNAPGIALPDSISRYPVFDLNPSPTVPPQLKSIAAAVALRPDSHIVLPN